MKDIAPELYERLKNAFDEKYGADKAVDEIDKIISAGKGTYRDADDYAVKVGQILAETFTENLKAEELPDGKLYYNIASRTVEPMLKNNHALVNKRCMDVQKLINESEGLGLRPVAADINDEYIKDLIDKVTDTDDFDRILKYLGEAAVSYSQGIVDSSVRNNAGFQSESGLSARVYRYFRPGLTNQKAHHERKYWACPYCKERECPNGIPYEEVEATGAWIWQRHPGCNCVIEYRPSRGFRQIRLPSRRESVEKNLERAAESDKIKGRKDLSRYIGQDIKDGDNQHVREWYVANVSDIPNQIDRSQPFEAQVKQAFELRNKYKHEARVAMTDEKTAEYLDNRYPAPTFEKLLKHKINDKGLSKEQALRDIFDSASKTNAKVNELFDL